MFGSMQNTVRISTRLVPDGPILVRAQMVGIHPGTADMEFQRTRRNGEETVFLAGSGLKGVIRSHCERLLRSAGVFACDPTQIRRGSDACGAPRDRNVTLDPRRYPHSANCGACFTFGSLKLAGRFRVSDAYPSPGEHEACNQTEVRAGVGIDRKSMAAKSGVLYDSEVVVGGSFDLQIQGENFSLWQLGLLLAGLQDLDAGTVRIGGAKARGMGTVRLRDWQVDAGFLNAKGGMLTGAQKSTADLADYRLPTDDVLASPGGHEELRQGLFRVLRYRQSERGGVVDALAAALIETPLSKYLGKAA